MSDFTLTHRNVGTSFCLVYFSVPSFYSSLLFSEKSLVIVRVKAEPRSLCCLDPFL